MVKLQPLYELEAELPTWDWIDCVVLVALFLWWDRLSVYRILLGSRLIISLIYRWRVYFSRRLSVRDVSLLV